ncbi:ABC transporter ATP-binding protein [Jiella sp. MQZ9-1]|uniref:ABC transporter ATP-binding protein n=1 Tax=Jiella flava TaxID=2816857 RepID=A0A939FY34_9HYPH|nr:ABC transporter ATP-binding protein [Jiella flava]MBO0662866.1 ABC transporter ATP-binding protein [Jiella flava]MCD2471374.1 ABC transporter ATP-binding protein [Jiella flava]
MPTASPSGAKLLTVENLTVALPAAMDRDFAVEAISFELAAAETLCIVGESGSGKSVTANAIMGLLPDSLTIQSGRIRLDGEDLLDASPARLRDLRGRLVSIVFQDPLSALNPLMTIGDQIAEVIDAHRRHGKIDKQARVVELLTEVGLPNPELIQKQYPFRLSGGQRQRVMIAMALALEPSVLIADEPTTALDVTTQAQILELIRMIQQRKGMGVMFITHDFGVVAEIADRVIVMEKGHLVEQGKARDVLQTPRHPYTQGLIAAVPRMSEAAVHGASQTPVVLSASGLKKTFRVAGGFMKPSRTVTAVDDVAIEVRKGQTVGIVGESGSGKSTLGRVLMKILDPEAGTIHFNGQDVAKMPEAEFRRHRPLIQMIFQDPFASLNPRQTVGRILTCGPMEHGLGRAEAKKRAERLLARVGLSPSAFERYPHEFSGGQRQRVGIARALMFDPELIIADEAVSALDVSVQAQILDLLAEIKDEMKLAMIFITHDLRIASRICDSVLVMQRGKTVEAGPPSEVFQTPKHDYTRQLVAAIPGGRWDRAA